MHLEYLQNCKYLLIFKTPKFCIVIINITMALCENRVELKFHSMLSMSSKIWLYKAVEVE